MIDGGFRDGSRWGTRVVVDEWMIRLMRHARFIVSSGRVMLLMLWVSSDSLGVACFRHAVALVLVVHRAAVWTASLTVGMDGRREALILRHVVHLMHLMETHTPSGVFTRIDGMGLVTWIPGHVVPVWWCEGTSGVEWRWCLGRERLISTILIKMAIIFKILVAILVGITVGE